MFMIFRFSIFFFLVSCRFFSANLVSPSQSNFLTLIGSEAFFVLDKNTSKSDPHQTRSAKKPFHKITFFEVTHHPKDFFNFQSHRQDVFAFRGKETFLESFLFWKNILDQYVLFLKEQKSPKIQRGLNLNPHSPMTDNGFQELLLHLDQFDWFVCFEEFFQPRFLKKMKVPESKVQFDFFVKDESPLSFSQSLEEESFKKNLFSLWKKSQVYETEAKQIKNLNCLWNLYLKFERDTLKNIQKNDDLFIADYEKFQAYACDFEEFLSFFKTQSSNHQTFFLKDKSFFALKLFLGLISQIAYLRFSLT
jgi:hypothetical protein